jgi:hypothetical protein
MRHKTSVSITVSPASFRACSDAGKVRVPSIVYDKTKLVVARILGLSLQKLERK